jgi:hypothetical protein
MFLGEVAYTGYDAHWLENETDGSAALFLSEITTRI